MADGGAWMPIYWADYFGDTMHLTTEEHGAYLLLIGTYWRNGGPLPADDQYLSRATRAGRRWGHIKKAVLPLFSIEASDSDFRASDNRLTRASEKCVNGFQIRHKRIDLEILRSSNRQHSAIANGRAGGLAKSKLSTTTSTTTEETVAKATVAKAPIVARSEVNDMAMAYNAVAERIGLATCAKITDSRRRALLKIPIAEWDEALRKLEASSFCRGANGKWRASIDFLLQPSSRQKLLEGTYDDSPNAAPTKSDAMLAGVLAAAGGGDAGQAVEPLPAGSQIAGGVENPDGRLLGSPGAVSGRRH